MIKVTFNFGGMRESFEVPSGTTVSEFLVIASQKVEGFNPSGSDVYLNGEPLGDRGSSTLADNSRITASRSGKTNA